MGHFNSWIPDQVRHDGKEWVILTPGYRIKSGMTVSEFQDALVVSQFVRVDFICKDFIKGLRLNSKKNIQL
jgi:hypothetical protein